MSNHIFGTSMVGYKKSDVQAYVNELEEDYYKMQREKDAEIAALKKMNVDLEKRMSEATVAQGQMVEAKEKITNVLLLAQEQAVEIIQNAKNRAVEEKKQLDAEIEFEKEKLVDTKSALKSLRREVTQTLKQFEEGLEQMIINIPDFEDELKSDILEG
jgi:cell division septum initiation protein DivIVA